MNFSLALRQNILKQAFEGKLIEEKEFYIRLAIKEKYSVRELARQIDSGYYERAMISKKKVSTVVTQIPRDAVDVFKDTYRKYVMPDLWSGAYPDKGEKQ